MEAEVSQAALVRRAKAKVALDRKVDFDRILHGYTDDSGKLIPAPYYWALNCTETFDEKWKEKGIDSPYRGFPELDYIRWLFHMMQTSRRLFVPKSREMMVTWVVLAYITWHAQIFPRTRAIVQTQSESKVADLIKGTDIPGYVRTLYERQPLWLKRKFPLSKDPDDQQMTRFGWANHSVIQGVPKGEHQVRQYHPTIYFCDEAAHVDDFAGSYGAADPVASQIIAVSSAYPGFFFDVVEESMES